VFEHLKFLHFFKIVIFVYLYLKYKIKIEIVMSNVIKKKRIYF